MSATPIQHEGRLLWGFIPGSFTSFKSLWVLLFPRSVWKQLTPVSNNLLSVTLSQAPHRDVTIRSHRVLWTMCRCLWVRKQTKGWTSRYLNSPLHHVNRGTLRGWRLVHHRSAVISRYQGLSLPGQLTRLHTCPPYLSSCAISSSAFLSPALPASLTRLTLLSQLHFHTFIFYSAAQRCGPAGDK